MQAASGAEVLSHGNRAAKPLQLAGTKENGSVIQAGHKTTDPTQYGAGGHYDSDGFLEPGEHEVTPDLDAAAIPEQLIIIADAKAAEVRDFDRLHMLWPSDHLLS